GGQPVGQRDGGMNGRHAAAPALLAGAHCDLLPVLLALVGALALQSHLAALGEQRSDLGDPQFDRFLDCPIHALPSGYGLAQMNPQRRLRQTADRRAESQAHLALADVENLAGPLLARPVEYLYRCARPEAQYPPDVMGDVAFQRLLA